VKCTFDLDFKAVFKTNMPQNGPFPNEQDEFACTFAGKTYAGGPPVSPGSEEATDRMPLKEPFGGLTSDGMIVYLCLQL
jgi:hypothetical protein